MWAFDFPKLSLLMASRQHETWHVIHYSVHVPCYLRLLHMAPVVSRHPNPFPQARGCFCGNHYTAPLPQRNGVTMMSAHSHSRLSASILTTYSTIDRIRFAGPIANSCKLTIWGQQLWVMKALRIALSERETHWREFTRQRSAEDDFSKSLKHKLL